jgi:hypothetical protein
MKIGIMSLTEEDGGDSALRCPRRRAQSRNGGTTEKRAFYHVRSVLPDGDAAAQRPCQINYSSKA